MTVWPKLTAALTTCALVALVASTRSASYGSILMRAKLKEARSKLGIAGTQGILDFGPGKRRRQCLRDCDVREHRRVVLRIEEHVGLVRASKHRICGGCAQSHRCQRQNNPWGTEIEEFWFTNPALPTGNSNSKI